MVHTCTGWSPHLNLAFFYFPQDMHHILLPCKVCGADNHVKETTPHACTWRLSATGIAGAQGMLEAVTSFPFASHTLVVGPQHQAPRLPPPPLQTGQLGPLIPLINSATCPCQHLRRWTWRCACPRGLQPGAAILALLQDFSDLQDIPKK